MNSPIWSIIQYLGMLSGIDGTLILVLFSEASPTCGGHLYVPDTDLRCQVSDGSSKLYPPEQAWQLCVEWTNFSAFLARCHAARFEYFNSCPSARCDIPDGLEPPAWELSQDMKNCYVTVAANYLIIAPEVLYGWFVLDEKTKAPTVEWGLKHWRMWAKSLEDLAKHYEGEGEEGAELLGLVKQARTKVLEVGKDLFVDEEVDGAMAEQLQKATIEDKDDKKADETTELVGEGSAEEGTETCVNDVVEKQTNAVERSKTSRNLDEVTPSDRTQTESDAIVFTAVAEESHDTAIDNDGKGEAKIGTSSDHATDVEENIGESMGDMAEKDTRGVSDD
jgi:hypothetical protein